MRIIVPFAASFLATAGFAQELVQTRPDQFIDLTASGNPTQPQVTQGRAFFTLYSYQYGREVWVTDGTPQGTHIVDELESGRDETPGGILAAAGGRALCVVGPSDEFWVTDGTPRGTDPFLINAPLTNVRVCGVVGSHVIYNSYEGLYATDLLPGHVTLLRAGPVQVPAQGSTVDGLLFLGVGDTMLVTDGTLANTREVRMPSGLGVYPMGNVLSYGGRWYFLSPWARGAALISTDGTTAGTVMHLYIPHFSVEPRLIGTPLGLLAVVNGGLYLTDGAAAVPVPVPPADIRQFTPCPGGAVFTGTTPALGRELWFTDGTPAGTRLLGDLEPGPADSVLADFTPAGNAMFFRRVRGAQSELWWTDFTQGGTRLVMTLDYDSPDLTAFDHRVLFAMATPASGRELWISDGTAQGTVMLTDGAARRDLLAPLYVGTVRGQALYVASEPLHGTELWHSDGTAAGTGLVADLVPGTEPFWGGGVQFRDEVWVALANGWWRSDGTAAGTRPLQLLTPGGPPITSPLWWLQVDGDLAWFVNSNEIYRTDGVLATLVGSLPQGFAQMDMAVSSTQVFVMGVPWSSSSRTLLAVPVAGGPAVEIDTEIDSTSYLYRLDDHHVLYGKQGWFWSTDGVHREPLPVRTWFFPTSVVWNGRTILFAGGGIYLTDGTKAGTSLVVQSWAAWQPVTTSHGVYFVGLDDHGHELWRTDGTAAATQRVTDLAPGYRDGVMGVTAVGDTLFLSASDGTSGLEPWVSDGTAAGTVRLADLWPGLAGSEPHFFGTAGDHLLFTGQHAIYGQSLFGMPLRQLGAAHVELYAGGCGLAAAGPALAVPALPRLGNAAFRFELDRAGPGAAVLFALGDDAGEQAMAGCTFWVGGSIDTFVTSAGPQGGAAWPLNIPNRAALVGQRLLVQAVAADPSSPGLAFSDALLLVIGR